MTNANRRDGHSPLRAEHPGRNAPAGDIRFDPANGFLEAELRRRQLGVGDRDVELLALLDRFARTAADLPVFVRQSHAERDFVALAERAISREGSPWTL